uniref:Uncharacterized protein n=1 Tax=Anguilla anguilla TaxID=7936 RepID=A0A0E9S2V8_ANGAN
MWVTVSACGLLVKTLYCSESEYLQLRGNGNDWLRGTSYPRFLWEFLVLLIHLIVNSQNIIFFWDCVNLCYEFLH